MKKIRSRGFGFYLENYQSLKAIKQKIYYEADPIITSNVRRLDFTKNDILSFFEYAENSRSEVTSLNFHVNLMCDYSMLYAGLDESVYSVISSLPQKIGNSFLNYTVGYRVKDMNIYGRSYYYYPVIYHENEKRYGIKGITDKEKIMESVLKFVSAVGCTNDLVNKLQPYCVLIQKLKGICISVSNDNKLEYKIYGRIDNSHSSDFISSYCFDDINNYIQYGDIILTAIRFTNNEIIGYNSYYAR